MTLHLKVITALLVAGLALSAVGILSAVYWVGFTDTVVSRSLARYMAFLDKTMRLLFTPGSGRRILGWQCALAAAVIACEIAVVDVPYWYGFVALAAVGPTVYLKNERAKRIKKLELQIDGFVLALANSLKTVPGPAAALQNIVVILQNPMRQEIERVVVEMRVGNTLEQSLVSMSARVGSRALDAALSSVLVGLQVGGNLPAVLETAAATIREMNRLDGVVKTKTGEGRAQLWVLAVFPFAICGAFNWMQPGYFDPLSKTFVGYLITTAAIVLWLGSLVLARKVLAVDI